MARWCARFVVAAMPVAAWLLARVTLDAMPHGAVATDAGTAVRGVGTGDWWSAPADPTALADAVTVLVAGAGAVGAAYLTIVTVIGLFARLAGRPHHVGPRAWRAVLAMALGTSLVGGLALPATAAAPGPAWGDAGAPASPPDVASWSYPAGEAPAMEAMSAVDVGGAVPPTAGPSDASVATGTAAHAAAPATVPSAAPAAAPSSAYVVQPGDSLWAIAAALLGPEATAAHIASAWPALYQANRDAIGEDPGLIHPGLALQIPAELLS